MKHSVQTLAWLNFWYKHMTTGRINQVFNFQINSHTSINLQISISFWMRFCISMLRMWWVWLRSIVIAFANVHEQHLHANDTCCAYNYVHCFVSYGRQCAKYSFRILYGRMHEFIECLRCAHQPFLVLTLKHLRFCFKHCVHKAIKSGYNSWMRHATTTMHCQFITWATSDANLNLHLLHLMKFKWCWSYAVLIRMQ